MSSLADLLRDPASAGVLALAPDELRMIDEAVADAGLQLIRVSLADCRDKAAALERIGLALAAPGGPARNYDALADQLRDLGWRPSGGHVLQFDDADALRAVAPQVFDALADILAEAARAWAERDLPFWAFFALEAADDTDDTDDTA